MIAEDEQRKNYHDLSGEIIGHQQGEKGNSLNFIIELDFKDNNWRIYRPYEKFEELLIDLSSDFALLPNIPPRYPSEYELSPQDVDDREEALDQVLQEILKRRDILADDRAIAWFEFATQGIKYPKIKPTSVTHVPSVEDNLTISKFYYSSDRGVLTTVYEDMSFLSKFGKMWSIIDKSQIGAYVFWRRVISSETNLPTFDKVTDKVYEQRVTTLLACPDMKKFFLAFDSGSILIINDVSEEGYNAYEEDDTIKLQSDRIMDMQMLNGKIVLISYGNALKIFDPIKREIVGGGSLKARLGDRNLHSLLVDERSSRIYLGTSANLMLIYNLEGNQPKYAGSLRSKNQGPIQTMHIDRGNLFSADGQDITTWSILLSKNEKLPKNTAVFSLPKESASHFEDAVVTSIANVSDHSLLFAGYSNGIMIVWNTKNGHVVSSFHAHSDRVTQISYLADRDVLISSSNNLKFWKVGEIQLDENDDEEESEETKATEEDLNKFDLDVEDLQEEGIGSEDAQKSKSTDAEAEAEEDDELLNEIEAELQN
eukprot:CAMPEP_0114982988 /NCGR_PEP_ID=MMETSP0216-20121206/6441_1 /TAXON_ID=223996 /ORGANISM="Protocruzia adherens, Strain Boccale" /LENGTH=539 /DNA_ID=CAMNT_0002344903 /DNA_START=125 /DNA_END=1744 /DNA_ORIENTATION=-